MTWLLFLLVSKGKLSLKFGDFCYNTNAFSRSLVY
jgi:hypothetical protein